VGLPKYNDMKNIFKSITTELKQVKWPTWKEILEMTIYVLIIGIIIALMMLALDLGFAKIRDWFLNI